MSLLTGARQSECLGLTWDRVDLKEGTLDIAWQLYQLPAAHGCLSEDGEPTCGRVRVSYCPKARLLLPEGVFDVVMLEGVYALLSPKSIASTRMIPAPPPLVDALRVHRKATLARPNPHGLVWTTPTGRPIARRLDSEAFDAMLRAAGVTDVPLHAARDTTATLLLELGVDAKVIQSVLGHASAATTRGYQHVRLDLARQALDGLGEALA